MVSPRPFRWLLLASLLPPAAAFAQTIPNGAIYSGTTSTPAPTFGSVVINPNGTPCAVGTSGCSLPVTFGSAALGSAVPGWGAPLAYASGGTLTGVSTSNQLPVTDPMLLTAVQASAGTSGGTAPTGIGYNGGLGSSGEPTKVTSPATVANWLDLTGKQVVTPDAPRELVLTGSASTTGSSATTLIAAQGASVKIYVRSVQCFRTDSATTTAYVTLNDTNTTGMGTTIVLPAGGGSNPWFGGTLVVAANTPLTFLPSAALTTVFCNAQGFKGY